MLMASLWQTMEVASGSWQEGCRWVHLWGEKEAAEGAITATLPLQALLLRGWSDSSTRQSPLSSCPVVLVTIDNWISLVFFFIDWLKFFI